MFIGPKISKPQSVALTSRVSCALYRPNHHLSLLNATPFVQAVGKDCISRQSISHRYSSIRLQLLCLLNPTNMSSHASSSNTSALPTSSSQPATQNDSRMTAVGVVLGVIGAFLVVGVVYATWRMKRRRSSNGASTESLVGPPKGTSLEQSHPAARITPFGSPGGETPRFKHTPGSDMRIAMRGADGAWHFADPRTRFSPSGVSEIDVLPSPLSSRSTMTLPSPVRTKEQEAKSPANLRHGYDRSEYDVDLNPPPPAYGYDYSGHLPPVKY
ncbi:hypothetical protein LshimejAT787_0410550 [Lyophyllum shimeji]|uniref:Uncharacterized protein n=1 Tax=Lyophyllum shimeji TaxID=47721 RepID=A0A9P3UKE4_LYOSH|nr:hypothetical protein LshimejAT787_0410550 [Lyophyllum shimeji]